MIKYRRHIIHQSLGTSLIATLNCLFPASQSHLQITDLTKKPVNLAPLLSASSIQLSSTLLRFRPRIRELRGQPTDLTKQIVNLALMVTAKLHQLPSTLLRFRPRIGELCQHHVTNHLPKNPYNNEQQISKEKRDSTTINLIQ
jgi:hypothetical protein